MKPSFERAILSLDEPRKPQNKMLNVPGSGAALPMGTEVPGLGSSGFGGGQ